MANTIHIDRKSLYEAMGLASSVISARDKNEIRKNCRLTVTSTSATVEATDSEIGLRVTLPGVTAKSPFSCLLPPKVLLILRELNCEFIQLEITDSGVNIDGESSDFKLSTADVKDFPSVEHGVTDEHILLPGKWLKSAIAKTVFACDTESTQYALGGLSFNFLDDFVIELAATDSRRMSVVSGKYGKSGNPDHWPNVIIPAKASALIGRFCGDSETVKLKISANSVVVEAGNVSLFTRLTEGRFPRYADVIPTDPGTTVTMIAGQLASAIRQATVVNNEDSHGTDFVVTDGNLTLKSTGAEIGSSKITIPVQVDGKKVETTLEGKFLLQFLGTLDAVDCVTMKVLDPYSAVLLTAEDYRYVVMPLSKD